MKSASPLCPYRQIGKVQIVDLIPRLSGPQGEAWLEVMERHFFQGLQRAVVVNISNALEMDNSQFRRLMLYMERPLKTAFYSHDHAGAKEIVPDYLSSRMPLLTEEAEVVKYFGLDLIERDRDVIAMKERRRYKRFKVVMPCEIITKDKQGLVTKAIVTNVSEGGAFAQYLDMDASMKMAGLGEKPRVPVETILTHPGTSECELVKGYIIRVEMLGQQRGVAIRFVPSLTTDSLLVKRFKGEQVEKDFDSKSAQKEI
jgi:hypothetical protein